jgi:arginine/ornithine transport system permease protein
MEEDQPSPIHEIHRRDFSTTRSSWTTTCFVVGVGNTIWLVALSLLIGGILSIPLAVLRAERHPIFSPIIWAYTYFFRGTPLLIQTFLIYYGLGQFEAVRESFAWPVLREAYWCALIAFA